MIIFGTRGVTSTPDRGEFACPQCGGTQPYSLKRVRRFFTLYFLPVIPLDVLGEYVECPTCQGTFDPKVLSHDPDAAASMVKAAFVTAVMYVMIGVLLADGEIDDSEVDELRLRFHDLTGIVIEESEVRETIDKIARSGASTTELAAKLSGTLNDHGKETTLRAAYSIAAADGHVDASEEAMLREVGRALGMSEAHYNGVMQEIAQGGAVAS